MPKVLRSRWGLQPVVVAGTANTDDDRSLHHLAEAPNMSARSSTSSSAAVTAASGDGEEDELTGRTLWDCAQVLWDLVADPRSENMFTVKGKRVVELGGGTGALSVGLARSGAASVTCTDLPCHLGRIGLTVRANSRTSTGSSGGEGSDSIGGGSVVAGAESCSSVLAGAAAAAARQASIRVAPLRWGDEEDIANVRKLSQNGSSGEGSSSRTNDGSSRGSDSEGGSPPFDVIVLSEVLYWPALDLLQEDTREPLLRTLVRLSKPGTKVILIYKERWPLREKEFLRSCERNFEVGVITADLLALPTTSEEEASPADIRAVVMVRLPPRRMSSDTHEHTAQSG